MVVQQVSRTCFAAALSAPNSRFVSAPCVPTLQGWEARTSETMRISRVIANRCSKCGFEQPQYAIHDPILIWEGDRYHRAEELRGMLPHELHAVRWVNRLNSGLLRHWDVLAWQYGGDCPVLI